jgi:hypothetical protein
MARAFDWVAAKLPPKKSIERRPVPRLTDRQMGRSKTPPAAVRHYTEAEKAAWAAANPVTPVPVSRRR